MATYRIKRKYFGLAEAASNTLGTVGNTIKSGVGGVLEGAGKAMDTSVGGLAGRIGGAMAGTAIGGVPGAILGFLAGGKMVRSAGKGIKNAGQDMQM